MELGAGARLPVRERGEGADVHRAGPAGQGVRAADAGERDRQSCHGAGGVPAAHRLRGSGSGPHSRQRRLTEVSSVSGFRYIIEAAVTIR